MSYYGPISSCPTVELHPKGDDEAGLEKPFREVLGSLVWLANMSRPDIAIRCESKRGLRMSLGSSTGEPC